MKLVIFGLSISSSWGNGHATLWRGLARALWRRGHSIVFFERDVPYYAANRDLGDPDFCQLIIYKDWSEAAATAVRQLNEADVGIVTSYCPDGLAATNLVLSSRVPVRVFYDLDSPVTLENLRARRPVSYIGPDGLRGFDLVLSYTGGPALEEIQERLGARRVEPLYGSVDPEVHHPVEPVEQYRSDLSYLGTYAEDRQRVLERLFIDCARKLPHCRFIIGGSLYPQVFPWTENIFFIPHVPPPEHSAFYCSSNLTLNVTRRAMADMGWCPSGRLFEAAACGVPILSDQWEGLDSFFQPGAEIVVAGSTDEAITALALPQEVLQRIARRARERTLAMHTAENRAEELERLLESAYARQSVASHAGEA